jgi:hypothetical protein
MVSGGARVWGPVGCDWIEFLSTKETALGHPRVLVQGTEACGGARSDPLNTDK